MPNLPASGIFSIDGIWLQPWNGSTFVSSAQAWIGAKSPTISGNRQVERTSIVGRNESISNSSGVVELDEGVLEGLILGESRNGLTGNQWLTRLDNLVKQQENYSNIWLVTGRLFYQKVELGSLEATPIQASGDGWTVTLPFWEKRYP